MLTPKNWLEREERTIDASVLKSYLGDIKLTWYPIETVKSIDANGDIVEREELGHWVAEIQGNGNSYWGRGEDIANPANAIAIALSSAMQRLAPHVLADDVHMERCASAFDQPLK